jgi:hypothetical protein
MILMMICLSNGLLMSGEMNTSRWGHQMLLLGSLLEFIEEGV